MQSPLSFDQFLNAINTKMAQFDYMGAVKLCDEFLKLLPFEAIVYELRGDFYLELQQLPHAIADFSNALSLREAQMSKNLGGLTLQVSSTSKNQQKNMTIMKSELSGVLEYLLSLLVKLSNAYITAQQYDNALLICEKAEIYKIKHHLIYKNLAIIQYNKGKHEVAILNLTSAIQLNPANFDYYYQRALNYHLLQQPRHAHCIIDCNNALKIQPGEANILLLRASAFNALGEHNAAVEDCETVLQKTPEDLDAMSSLMKAHIGLKKFETVVKLSNAIIARNPLYTNAYLYRATAFYKLKSYQDAIENCKKVLEIDPHNSPIKNIYYRTIVIQASINRKKASLQEKYTVIQPAELITSRLYYSSLINCFIADEPKSCYFAASSLHSKNHHYQTNPQLLLDRVETFNEIIAELTLTSELSKSNETQVLYWQDIYFLICLYVRCIYTFRAKLICLDIPDSNKDKLRVETALRFILILLTEIDIKDSSSLTKSKTPEKDTPTIVADKENPIIIHSYQFLYIDTIVELSTLYIMDKSVAGMIDLLSAQLKNTIIERLQLVNSLMTKPGAEAQCHKLLEHLHNNPTNNIFTLLGVPFNLAKTEALRPK